MPLIQSKSKKALKQNIETEMKANPSSEDRAQNLAIAYDVRRRNRKNKMAHGGEVPKSLSPIQEEVDNDFTDIDEEIYDEDQLEAQPEESNEHAVAIPHDENDHISRIMKKLREKRGT